MYLKEIVVSTNLWFGVGTTLLASMLLNLFFLLRDLFNKYPNIFYVEESEGK